MSGCWFIACVLQASGSMCSAQSPGHETVSNEIGRNPVEAFLESRVALDPNNAAAWRLLGLAKLKNGDRESAYQALERAVKLDPHSVAANFDFGRILMAEGREEEAVVYLQQAVKLAPESEYADRAKSYLTQIPGAPPVSEIAQIGFEVKAFDGSEVTERLQPLEGELRSEDRPYYSRLEVGAVYNSNVALSPISRELAPGERASFQGFLSPELELRLLDSDGWHAGPSLLGYFSWNEGNFEEFNVQNYQPGFFLERSVEWGAALLQPRVQYDFTHDEFDGETFGNRHALTLSSRADWSERHASFCYWSIDHTNFASDGLVPEFTSRDGWTNTLGFSQTLYTEMRHLRSLRGGIDFQAADTKGSDFTYRGVSIYTVAEMPLTASWSTKVHLGWGYRDYPNFLADQSRNENIWRAAIRLRKQFSEQISASGVFNYDRFDSESPLFDADRYVTGIQMTYEY